MREIAHWDTNSSLTASRDWVRVDMTSRIGKGKDIQNMHIKTLEELEYAKAQRSNWNDYNVHLLKLAFSGSENSEEYVRVAAEAERLPSLSNSDLSSHVGYFRESLDVTIQAISQLIDRLALYPEPRERTYKYPSAQETRLLVRPKTKGGPISQPENREGAYKVFLVHGHDEGMKQAVARFIEKLGLETKVLHEQPSAGKTLIEKLEAYSDVEYVVVLLSPDDVGASRLTPKELHHRPRQNVVFEMGFFVGKLARDRVCAIVKGKVEIHSDIQGMVYISMDNNGAWQLGLVKELKKAGFKVSLDALA